MSISTFTVAQLKEELKKRNVSFGSRALKAELKSLLQAAIDKSTASGSSGTKRGRSESIEAPDPSTSTKKQKKSDPSPTKSTKSTTSSSKTPKGKSSKSTKPKDPPPPPKLTLPGPLLFLVKSYIPTGLDSLRTHLAFAGTSKLIRDTCYASDDVWKGLALQAGFGRPVLGLGGGKYGVAKPISWRAVVRDVINCPVFAKIFEPEDEALWNTILESSKSFTVLKPEQFIDQNAFVELSPYLKAIDGRPTSIQSLSLDPSDENEPVALSSCPSAAYALACYPPLEIMGVKSIADKPLTHFAYANNSEGVTVSDFWNAICKAGRDIVPERDLLPIFLAANPNVPKSRASWTDTDYDEYEEWLQFDMNGAHVKRCATILDTLAPADATFDGDIDQLGQGCLLFSVGMDY